MIKNLKQRIVIALKRRGLLQFYSISDIPESGKISDEFPVHCIIHNLTFYRSGTELERSGICPECNKELNLRKTRQNLRTPHLDLSKVPIYALSTEVVNVRCIRCNHDFSRRLDYLAKDNKCPKCGSKD